MSTLAIVLVVIGALIVLLATGGLIGATRRARHTEGAFRDQLERVNNDLALAHAQDNGWDRATMEAAAREAHGGAVEQLLLVQIVDLPGTDADEAVFEIVSGGTTTRLTLARRDGAWVAK